MFQLELHGMQAVLVDRDENDLWVRTKSGRMLTVQVKTAGQFDPHSATPTFKFYAQNLSSSTDVYALVALQPQIVLFCRPDDFRVRIKSSEFTPERMLATLEACFT